MPSSKGSEGTRQERARLLAAKAKALDPVEDAKEDSVMQFKLLYLYVKICNFRDQLF